MYCTSQGLKGRYGGNKVTVKMNRLDYNKVIFSSYHSLHGKTLDHDEKEKTEWFTKYLREDYVSFFDLKKENKILEIGSK